MTIIYIPDYLNAIKLVKNTPETFRYKKCCMEKVKWQAFNRNQQWLPDMRHAPKFTFWHLNGD